MRLRFDQSNGEKILNLASASQIDDILKELNSTTNSYVILESEYDYVQCAGNINSLTIEARIHKQDSSFKHYTLGNKDMSKIWHTIECKVGPIRVLAHENLDIEDAKIVFNYFYMNNKICPDYNKRNVTKYYLKND